MAVTVLLRQPGGPLLGSGVLVRSMPGGVWIVTNRHVVDGQRLLCVVTADRRVSPALVLPPSPTQHSNQLDLALLWLPWRNPDPPLVASMHPRPPSAAVLPLVVSTGYPTPLQPSPDGPVYTESPGLLLPLLKDALQGGFDLAYTAAVEKGMSGGGVFIGGQLIGINGTHSQPLWPGQWRQANGKPLPDDLNDKLELVALGISASTIEQALKTARQPDANGLAALTKTQCRKN